MNRPYSTTSTATPPIPTSPGSIDPNAIGVELGSSGLKIVGPYVYDEWMTELQGAQGKAMWREMSDGDPTVRAVLWAVSMLCRGVSWKVKAASRQPVDKEIADFCDSARYDMDSTWSDTVGEIFSMLPFGFSVHEKVYKFRRGRRDRPASKHDDGRIGWKRLPVRAQESILEWGWDEHNDVKSVVQMAAPQYRRVVIPREKFLHFRTTSSKNNPEGFSYLRGAYTPYRFKKNVQIFEGIGIERDLCGLPMFSVPPHLLYKNASAEDKALLASLQAIVQRVRVNEQGGIIVPMAFDDRGNPLYKFELIASAGAKQIDTNPVIQRKNQEIACSMLADFILLGHEKVGSFALASSKTELFALAIGAWLDSICEVFNRDAFPALLDINGWSDREVPELEHGDIETPDLNELGTFLGNAVKAGANLFPNAELDRYLLRAAHLPEPPEADDSGPSLLPEGAGGGAEDAGTIPGEQVTKSARRQESFIW